MLDQSRRTLMTLLGGAAVLSARPHAAHAQQPTMPVVGYLYPGMPELSSGLVAAFRTGLREAGLVEGRNVSLEYRFASNDYNRLPGLAADLVGRRVAVIVTPGGPTAALAAKAATATIPIVFSMGGDPVQRGLVASFNRPGGNVTGITSLNAGLAAKRLGLLHELLPGAARFAVLVSPNSVETEGVTKELEASASAIRRQIEVLPAGASSEIDRAFARFAAEPVDGLLVSPGVLFDSRRVQLAILAAHHRLPAIYPFRESVEVGGLMSYGSSAVDRDRQVGHYVGRILKGEKPADLPVMQATKFELVINLQTARTLGLTVPPSLLATADAVVE
jgi:putative ABC transport system substrate-binding protein